MNRFIGIMLLAANSVHAADEAAKPAAIGSPLVVPTAGYFEAVAGLLLIILLILGLGWAVKRMGIAPVSKGAVRIVGGASLGAREKALLLEVEGKRILVGVAPGQVRPLMRLDDAQTPAGQAREEPLPSDREFEQQLQLAQDETQPGTNMEKPS